MIRRTTLAVAATALTLTTLAGCGGSESEAPKTSKSSKSEPSASSAPKPFDKATAQSALLTEADFPGYTALPQDQLKSSMTQGGDLVTKMMAEMKVQPAECQKLVSDNMSSMQSITKKLDQVAMTVFTKEAAQPQTAYEAIGPVSVLPYDAAKSGIDSCRKMTLDMGGIKATASIESEPVDLGDQAFAMVQSTTVDVGGRKVTTDTAVGWAQVGDTVINVGQTAPDLSLAAAKELVKKAYDKAESTLK